MKGENMNTKEIDAKIKAYFLDNIDGTGYDRELTTDKEKFTFVIECFRSEYGHEIDRQGEYAAFSDYLSALPSCLHIAFYNGEILELATEWGAATSTEHQKDKVLEGYFSFMACKFMKFARRLDVL